MRWSVPCPGFESMATPDVDAQSGQGVDKRPSLCVLSPTFLEYWSARARIRSAPVLRVGIAGDVPESPGVDAFVVCGLAGSLTDSLPSGSVVIPEAISTEHGRLMPCHPALVHSMVDGAATLGLKAHTGNMLTASSIVTGGQRERWAERGFVAADMEAGHMLEKGWSVAVVRIILDTPAHSISSGWLDGPRAALRASLWAELSWMAVRAPRYALRAADVVQRGLSHFW